MRATVVAQSQVSLQVQRVISPSNLIEIYQSQPCRPRSGSEVEREAISPLCIHVDKTSDERKRTSLNVDKESRLNSAAPPRRALIGKWVNDNNFARPTNFDSSEVSFVESVLRVQFELNVGHDWVTLYHPCSSKPFAYKAGERERERERERKGGEDEIQN